MSPAIHIKAFKRIIRPIRRIIFLCTLLFPLQPLLSQNYYFDSYGVAEGLAQSTVYDIMQDTNDYLWLGTKAGVSRFNGKEFNNYSLENGLAENGVRTIYKDTDNRIWFGHSGGGVSYYDGRNFHVFSAPGKKFNSDITGIVRDKQGNLWISSELSGVVKISRTGNTLDESESETFFGDRLSDRVFGIYLSEKGSLYFITDAFIKFYKPDGNSFVNLDLKGMPSFFLITCMFEDSRSNLWFGTYHGGLYKYDVEKDSFKIYDIRDGLASNWISSISEDFHGNCWVGTWGEGITVISDKELKTYNLQNGLNDLKIRKILQDKEGNMLIGTHEHGLSIFKGEQFVSFTTDDGLLNSQVWSVIQDKTGKYWFGTNEGISIYDESLPLSKRFQDFYKLKGNRIRMIKEDREGRIWISTDAEGIFTYVPKTSLFTYEPKLNSYLPKLVVTALETDKKGRVWAGTLDGLVGYDYNAKQVMYFTQTSGLAGNDITALFCDSKDNLWIGSRNSGLTVLKDTVFSIPNLGENFTATCMIEDQKGLLWVGTEAQGILVIDPENNKIVKSYKESDGLLGNLINLLNIDKNNNIYIGTNKGLNVYKSEKDKLYTYTAKNGFTGIETKANSTFRDSRGMLWFGTVAGVNRYDPAVKTKINETPLTHIIGFKVNLKNREIKSGLKLRYSDNNIIIDYISICLTNPSAVKYKIKLEGADNDWRTTTQTSVTYPALAPKKYSFLLMAQNSEGIWNSTPITLQFQINPPFYKTWWFILICIFFGATVIVVYVKVRESNLIKEKRILEEKVIERTAEVVQQKEELAQKNKDITDSIRYAKRIQLAILPPDLPFENTFILFKPKDIVSGDFYWLDVIGDLEFLAAVDCTGHGVPGAFMSIIGSNSLNKIVKEYKIFKPSDILDRLNIEVTSSLQRHDSEGGAIQDGMDMALICYNRKTRTLEFAGAFNPLWLVRDGALEEIKADRFAIGRNKLEEEKKFTNNVLQMQKGDAIYFFSDGFADQFGGETGKKFKAKPMKELVLAIQDIPMNKQKEVLESTLEAWRGEIEQVDDILVIGRKF
ncbi:MAG: SpoIIE family protein phosphatase [Bacteroidales bacterium]|nr:SpoIIE family protein phosphatase [Bacteroidales bacterium]MCB8998570.1 SpoIIE family protein phosphatase [Bacteroidales bacterium]MCB9012562.1 SpoIIE family protein phosphatase [Bacteroidales bacterium]